LIKLLSLRLSALGSAERDLPMRSEAIERDYHLLLDTYRQANLAVRGTEPPAYFSDRPTVIDRVRTDNARPVQQQLEETIKAVEAVQGQHRDDLNKKLNQLQSQTSEILSTTFEQFKSGIEEEAEEVVQKDIQVMPKGV
jgi:gas vesicle protein